VRLRDGARRPVAGLALVLLAGACTREEAPAPGPPLEPVQAVVERLGAAAFGTGETPLHGPMLKIGDEAREVLLAPREIAVASLRGVQLDAEGRARREVALPEEARALPDEAFVLEVQELPFAGDAPAAVFDLFAKQTYVKRVPSLWTLERSSTQPTAAVVFAPETRAEGVQYNAELHLLLPQPKVLETALDAPAGASLELGWAVAADAASRAVRPLRFRAVLACAGAPDRTLLDETLDAREPGGRGWRDGSFPLPAGGACRLRLESATPDGGDARLAAWTVPRVLAPQTLPAAVAATNVILISLDTLRADHLSGYGYPRATSPAIDARLIAGGTTFRDASTTFPRTDVGHLSLFTGLYPAAQPALGRVPAGSSVRLLAESLRDAGLTTAAFTEDALVAGAFGFWFGFDRFVERTYDESGRGLATFADGIDFLQVHRERRFFLFLHTYKTHTPYVAAERYRSFAPPGDWQTLPLDPRIPERERAAVDAYDRTIREADDLVAGLLDALDRLGLAERTLVVLLSDHGEAFGEHGALEHGFAGHDEQVRIPLVLRGPGVPRGLDVATPVSIVDVAPTVLALAGAPPLPAAQGISLAPALAGGTLPDDRPLFFAWAAQGAAGVRRGATKYLRADHGHESFDLAMDPQEQRPRGRREPPPAAETALLERHAAESAQLRARFEAPAGEAAPTAIEGRMEESLRALGYVE
jgi:arylsulfatase A-like enzyme